jgi:hypothetical protein
VDKIKQRLGPDSNIYNAIKSGRTKSTAARNLLGSENSSIPAYSPPGLVDLGDGRILSGGLECDIQKRRTFCSSFDQDWQCLGCGPHGGHAAFKIRGVADSYSSRKVVILADQSVPTALPTAGEQQCIRFLIVENGKLREMADLFLEKLGNRRVPPGTVVLIFSAAYLAETGIVNYCEELISCMDLIQSKTGKETIVAPLPPMLLGGSDSPALIRSIFELITWCETYFMDSDGFLEASFIMSRVMLSHMGKDSRDQWETRRMMLPCNVIPGGKRAWTSGGKDSRAMPCSVKPMTMSMEKEMFGKIIGELIEKRGLDLDPNPNFDRGLGTQSNLKRKTDFLVVGSSNAKRTAKALEEDNSVRMLFVQNWRVNRASCESLAVRIADAIKESDPEVIVLQLLDGSCFYARGEDGSRTLPVKSADGKFHIVGDMVVCPGEVQLEHLNGLKPIFDAIDKRPCLLVMPMPRYVIEGCCGDSGHIANRVDRHFREDMCLQLEGLKNTVKHFLFTTGRRSYRIIDTLAIIRGLPNEDIWFCDPVHPINSIYSRIAGSVQAVAADLTAKKYDHEKRGSSRGGRGSSRGRWSDGGHGGGHGGGYRGRGGYPNRGDSNQGGWRGGQSRGNAWSYPKRRRTDYDEEEYQQSRQRNRYYSYDEYVPAGRSMVRDHDNHRH